MVDSEWSRAEPHLRERAYATIEADPGFLLETDGGPYGIKADLILARLIGHDDQIVRDDLRLPDIRPVWLEPIHEPLTAIAAPPAEYPYPTFRTAEYRLRSGFATMDLSAEAVPPPDGVKPDIRTLLYTVLFLRYKRRLS